MKNSNKGAIKHKPLPVMLPSFQQFLHMLADMAFVKGIAIKGTTLNQVVQAFSECLGGGGGRRRFGCGKDKCRRNRLGRNICGRDGCGRDGCGRNTFRIDASKVRPTP